MKKGYTSNMEKKIPKKSIKKKILIVIGGLVSIVIFLYFIVLPIWRRNALQEMCDEYGPNLVPVRNKGQFSDICGSYGAAGGPCSFSWICVNKDTGLPFELEDNNNITNVQLE